jgi:hypothetical protein
VADDNFALLLFTLPALSEFIVPILLKTMTEKVSPGRRPNNHLSWLVALVAEQAEVQQNTSKHKIR